MGWTSRSDSGSEPGTRTDLDENGVELGGGDGREQFPRRDSMDRCVPATFPNIPHRFEATRPLTCHLATQEKVSGRNTPLTMNLALCCVEDRGGTTANLASCWAWRRIEASNEPVTLCKGGWRWRTMNLTLYSTYRAGVCRRMVEWCGESMNLLRSSNEARAHSQR
jgi:hypothetical protein